jgi:monovalent cation:H+ antiporter-2, CPA2 family
MTDYGVLSNLLVIFSVSIAVVFLFHQFRLPSIAGFLVAGALIGPHGLNLIGDIGTVQVLAEIGVVLLLFTIGIEFSLVQLASRMSAQSEWDCAGRKASSGDSCSHSAAPRSS